MSHVNDWNGFALVPRPPSAVEKAHLGAKRILCTIVADTLAMARLEGAETIFNRGMKYYRGDGVPQDYTEAVKWFRKAADNGLVTAQEILAVCYACGDGVPQDDTEAVKWHRKAAEQGLAMSQDILGLCYACGKGIPKDEAEAVKWYHKAAEQVVSQSCGARSCRGTIRACPMLCPGRRRPPGLSGSGQMVPQSRRAGKCGGTMQAWPSLRSW